jgi:hypothetical protein
MEVSGELHVAAALPLEKEPDGIHCIEGWVGPRARCGRFGEEENLSPLLGSEPRIIHTVA